MVKRKETLNLRIYNKLKDMIADYRFIPGTRVNVEQLTRELRVSRVPVWEAIRRLEQEGLLKNIPNRGVFMAEMTLEKAFEIFQVRGGLERLASRLITQNIDNRVLEKVGQCLGKQLKAVEQGDLVLYSRLDLDFHSLIYKMIQNTFLREILDSIKTKMQPFRIELKPILTDLYQDHLRIFNALKTKNPDKVEEAFIQHNERVLQQIKEDMEKETERAKLIKRLKKGHVSFLRGSKIGLQAQS